MTNQKKAYNYIKEQIITGKYRPGHLLSENQMGIRLNLSRTPIREAINMLETEGLIERNGQETRVTNITAEELKENYDLRSMLEAYALKKNFDNLDEAKLINIKKQLIQAGQEQNWSQYIILDKKLHLYLTSSANDSTLQKSLDLLNNQTDRMRYTIDESKLCVRTCVKELIEIIDTILNKDKNLTIELLQDHISKVFSWESEYFKQEA